MNQQPFITLVDQILAVKKQHTPLSPLDRGELPVADTSALEKQIDEIVYKLYDPAYQHYQQAASRRSSSPKN